MHPAHGMQCGRRSIARTRAAAAVIATARRRTATPTETAMEAAKGRHMAGERCGVGLTRCSREVGESRHAYQGQGRADSHGDERCQSYHLKRTSHAARQVKDKDKGE